MDQPWQSQPSASTRISGLRADPNDVRPLDQGMAGSRFGLGVKPTTVLGPFVAMAAAA